MLNSPRWALMATLLAGSAASGQTPPAVSGVIGSPTTFATHAQLASYGFSFGPSDGAFGAIPAGGNTYTFYGDAGSSAACAGTPNTDDAFSFTGTLDQVVVVQLSIGVRWADRSWAERWSMPRTQAANSKSLLMN
jgi:hypothetical protein